MFAGGPADGTVLILHHGTPGCGMLYPGWIEPCAAREVRLVGYSRPGYGDSSRHAGRSVADCAADVSAVAKAVGAERFYVVGHSGGGSHALACAALLPDRVLATAVIAAAAPWNADGLDWLAGQLGENVAEFNAAVAGGETLRRLLEEWRAEMLGEAPSGDEDAAGEGADEAFASLISAPDRAVITPETWAFAGARRNHALAPGIWGWFDDDLTETKPWGFDPTEISGPVSVWHGGHDRFVPFAHGRWLAENIPHARPHLLDEEGHFSIVERRMGEVVDDLIALASPR